jgi:hypothetical protein
MRGHEPIIKMRMQGVAPSFVFINDFPCDTSWFDDGDHATVSVAGDYIETLNLHYLVGLRVSISSDDLNRTKALYEACKRIGVKQVAACHTTGEHPPEGWTAIYTENRGEKIYD